MNARTFLLPLGFRTYREGYERMGGSDRGQGGRLREINPELLAWLEGHAGERFFVLVHSYDVHAPYVANSYSSEFDPAYDGQLTALDDTASFLGSELFRRFERDLGDDPSILSFISKVINDDRMTLSDDDRRHVVALYDGEIRQLDDHFCALMEGLERLDLLDRTVIVVTSDHGEELFEHGRLGHGGRPYDYMMRVPLIVRAPGGPGATTDALAQGIDIAPTILQAIGLPIPPSFAGRSLLDPDASPNEFAAAETGRGGAHATLRTVHHKLMVLSEKTRLFDLRSDPGERHDVASENAELVAALKARLWDALDRVELDEREIEGLRALGYTD